MNKNEPLLSEEKEELIFSKDEPIQKEEAKQEEKPLVVDAVDEIVKNITGEISIHEIEQDKEESTPSVEVPVDTSSEMVEKQVSFDQIPSQAEKKEESVSEDKETIVVEKEESSEVSKEEKNTVIEEVKEKEKPEEDKKEVTEDSKTKKSRGKGALIVTLVCAALVLYLLGKTLYGFYLGFKYKDYDPSQDAKITTTVNQNNSK